MLDLEIVGYLAFSLFFISMVYLKWLKQPYVEQPVLSNEEENQILSHVRIEDSLLYFEFDYKNVKQYVIGSHIIKHENRAQLLCIEKSLNLRLFPLKHCKNLCTATGEPLSKKDIENRLTLIEVHTDIFSAEGKALLAPYKETLQKLQKPIHILSKRNQCPDNPLFVFVAFFRDQFNPDRQLDTESKGRKYGHE